MRSNKKYRRGIFLLFLLLLIIPSIPIIKNVSNNDLIDENSISISAPEDPYEENDDPLSAYYIGFSEGYWLSYIMGEAAQWDDDYYEIYVSPGEERLIVFLRFKNYEGDIDLEVINGTDLSVISGSYSVSDNEYIDTVIPAGTYYLRVYYGNAGNNYDLFWEDLDPAMIEDYYEENDYEYEAYWLPQDSWLSDTNGLGFQNDDDWYEIRLEPGEEHLFAELVYNRDMGWLQMDIYDGFSWWSFGDVIDYTFGFSGTLWLRIYGDNSGMVYNLWWENSGTPDDDMEENDDFYSAAWLEHRSDTYSLKMMDYDEDWFMIDLSPGDTIEFKIWFDDYYGDLNLELWQPDESLWDGTGYYSGYGYKSIMYTLYNYDESGLWRIHVYRTSGSEDMWYDLEIQFPLEEQPDDSFEDNDNFGSAYPLTPGWYGDLKAVNDDQDWFKMYLNTGDIIDVSIYFNHYDGDLQLELYDPTNTKRKGSYSSTEQSDYDWSKPAEQIMYRADMSGEWRIKVYHETGDSEVYYQLEIWIREDFYEYNDDWSEAYNLKDDEHIWLSDLKGLAVQEYNDDWYRIVVSPGFEHLMINLKFNTSVGDIDIYIYHMYDEYSLDWSWTFYNGSMSGDDSIDIDGFLPWGVYLIQIIGDSAKTEYDLWWDDIRTDFRSDDDYEENDDPLTAYDLSYSENAELWHISGWALQYDDDWYRIWVDSVRTHIVVHVQYDYQEGAIGVELYNWNNNRVNMSFSEKDNEFLVCNVLSNGTYYIRIFGDRTGNVYSLNWYAEEPHIEEGWIPGYDIFILLGAIFGIATVITIKLKRSKRNL
ncbi:MAG: hypothetical protein ACFFCV_21770 [Promethearchaeota archaeon]